MNSHLNIFRPFSQNLSKENIEDNLSRAFVLWLLNNGLLFHKFLRTVFSGTNQYQAQEAFQKSDDLLNSLFQKAFKDEFA